MNNNVRFEDFSVECEEWMEEQAIAALYEAAGELVAATQRNVPAKGRWFSDQRDKWKYEVDEEKLEATIGNPWERSLWTEFGTGEYAQNGDGRKGYWIYVKETDGETGGTTGYAYKGGKSYTLEEAKRLVAMMREDGLDAHYTKGQQPHRPFQKAYTKLKPKIIKMFQERFKG